LVSLVKDSRDQSASRLKFYREVIFSLSTQFKSLCFIVRLLCSKVLYEYVSWKFSEWSFVTFNCNKMLIFIITNPCLWLFQLDFFGIVFQYFIPLRSSNFFTFLVIYAKPSNATVSINAKVTTVATFEYVFHIISLKTKQHTCSLWAHHQWKTGWLDNPTRLCTFITDTGTTLRNLPPKNSMCIRLNSLRTGVGRFCSCLHKWVCSLLRLVSVAQKNKPSTMLSSNVQSIYLPMDCTTLRFWTIRQSNV